MMRCHRTAFPDPAVSLLGRLTLVAGVFVLSLVIGMVAVCSGQEETGQQAIEEPRTLQAPVTLLPVTPGGTEESSRPAKSPAGPVVKLAPDLLAHQRPQDRTATQATAGVRRGQFSGHHPG